VNIQDFVYDLAVKMLWHPDHAKDATQDILIRILTHLSSFKQKSSFKTWVYRLAANSLINYKLKMQKRLSFETFAIELNEEGVGVEYSTENQAEHNLLVQEAKIGCSNAMLQCLDVIDRIIYILGEILAFSGKEAAEILEIKPATFRQRLGRIRKKMNAFLQKNCGLVNSSNACRCKNRMVANIKNGRINPINLLFARDSETLKWISTIDNLTNEVALFQSNPVMTMPQDFLEKMKSLLTILT